MDMFSMDFFLSWAQQLGGIDESLLWRVMVQSDP